MRKIFLVVPSILFTFLLSAQSSDKISDDLRSKNFDLDLNIGAGIPINDYGNTLEVPIPTSHPSSIYGLATTGFHFDADLGYMFTPVFGGMIRAGGDINSFNAAQWQTNSSLKATSAGGSFYIGQYFIGPFAIIEASDKLNVEIRALAGIVTANFPTLNSTDPMTGVVEQMNIKSANDFGYCFSLGLKYMIKDNFGINFTIGYTGSNITYPQDVVTDTEAGVVTTTDSNLSRTMDLGIIQITTGVTFKF